jgi:hypothetical protein
VRRQTRSGLSQRSVAVTLRKTASWGYGSWIGARFRLLVRDDGGGFRRALRVPDSIFRQPGLHVLILATRCARALRQLRPSFRKEGAGKAGCRLHPWAPCNKKHGGRATGSTGNIPAFPARWFTTYFVLSPVTGSLATVAARILPRNLAPASGRQDHTTSPSATACVRLRKLSASTASHRAFVTLRNAPLIG